MSEYLIGVVCASLVLGVVSYLSYPGVSERATKLCVSVLLLYALAMPLFRVVGQLSELGIQDIFGKYQDTSILGGAYTEVSEAAFEEGIARLVSEKYGVDKDDIRVFSFGFDFKEMRAEKIKILLSGKGALSDRRLIESYITESGLGECEVNIQIG